MTRYTKTQRRTAIAALDAADAAVQAHEPTHADSDHDETFQKLNDAAWDAARNPALPWRIRIANRWLG